MRIIVEFVIRVIVSSLHTLSLSAGAGKRVHKIMVTTRFKNTKSCSECIKQLISDVLKCDSSLIQSSANDVNTLTLFLYMPRVDINLSVLLMLTLLYNIRFVLFV